MSAAKGRGGVENIPKFEYIYQRSLNIIFIFIFAINKKKKLLNNTLLCIGCKLGYSILFEFVDEKKYFLHSKIKNYNKNKEMGIFFNYKSYLQYDK